jgi:hypothetical protein
VQLLGQLWDVAWMNKLMDYAMPYVIQSVKEYPGKVRGWNLTQDMQCRTDVVQQHQAATAPSCNSTKLQQSARRMVLIGVC